MGGREACQSQVGWPRGGEDEEVTQDRDDLIEEHVELVEKIAGRLYKERYTDDVEYNDYFQYGMEGLLSSIDRFDQARGASFATYASYRIKGAILNGVAKETEKRHQEAYRARARRARVQSLTDESGDGYSFDELVDITAEIAISQLLEIHEDIRQEAVGNAGPYESRAIDELVERVGVLVERLAPKEQTVIKEHYYGMKTFEDIGREMELTKGRISQIHKKAINIIRDWMEDGVDGYL